MCGETRGFQHKEGHACTQHPFRGKRGSFPVTGAEAKAGAEAKKKDVLGAAPSPARLSVARPSFDVWSLGVVLFELCAGHALFRQDTSNDELVEDTDRTRLCTWHTVGEQQLGLVRS